MSTELPYLPNPPQHHFSAHNFISISFPYYNHHHLWNGSNQLLVNLKHMDLNHSSIFSISNLSNAQKLEDLNMEGCVNLVGVSSIQHLTKLQHLNLKGCQSLKGLPSLIKLKFLRTLNLSHCSNLIKLPPSLGCLSSVCELNLRNCVKLYNLPRSVMNLMRSLQTLNVSGCSGLWETFARCEEDASVPFSTQLQLGGITSKPCKGIINQRDLASSSNNSMAQFDLASNVRNNTIDLEDVDSFISIALIDCLPSGTGLRALLPHNTSSSDSNVTVGNVLQESFDDDDDDDDQKCGPLKRSRLTDATSSGKINKLEDLDEANELVNIESVVCAMAEQLSSLNSYNMAAMDDVKVSLVELKQSVPERCKTVKLRQLLLEGK